MKLTREQLDQLKATEEIYKIVFDAAFAEAHHVKPYTGHTDEELIKIFEDTDSSIPENAPGLLQRPLLTAAGYDGITELCCNELGREEALEKVKEKIPEQADRVKTLAEDLSDALKFPPYLFSVFGTECEYIAGGLNEINGFPVKDLRSAAVLAKMHILQKQKAPFTLRYLQDMKQNTKTLNVQITELLKGYIKLPEPPAFPRGDNESDENYLNRQKKARLEKFNTEFFGPACQDMVTMLRNEHERALRGTQSQYANQLLPFGTLIDEMSDSMNTCFQNHSDGLDKDKITSSARSMKVISNTVAMKNDIDRLSAEKDEENEVQRKRYINILADKAAEKLEYQSGNNLWSQTDDPHYKHKPVEVLDAHIKSVEKGRDAVQNVFSADTGILSHLTADELNTLATDPVLGEMLTVRRYSDDYRIPQLRSKVCLGLSEVNLQINTPYNTVSESLLVKVKKMISTAKSRQEFTDAARFTDFSRENLENTSGALMKAEKMLSDLTHFYNTSPNYIAMQTKLKDLRKYVETLGTLQEEAAGEGEDEIDHPTREEQGELVRYTEEALKAVKQYLAGKNALHARTVFANSYERDRVIAAKSLLRMLDGTNTSLRQLVEQKKYDKMFDEIKGLMEQNNIRIPEGFTREKYCSPERITLHGNAKSILKKADKCTESYKKNMQLPDFVRRHPYSFFSTGDDALKRNAAIMQDLTDKDPKARQEIFLNTVNRINQLDKSRLDPAKNSLEQIAEYSMANYPGIALGEKLGGLIEAGSEFGLTAKKGQDIILRNMGWRMSSFGEKGVNAVKIMADDYLFMLPYGLINEDELSRLARALPASTKNRQGLVDGFGNTAVFENYREEIPVVSSDQFELEVYKENHLDETKDMLKLLGAKRKTTAEMSKESLCAKMIETVDNLRKQYRDNAGASAVFKSLKDSMIRLYQNGVPYEGFTEDYTKAFLCLQLYNEVKGQKTLNFGQDTTALSRLTGKGNPEALLKAELDRIKAAPIYEKEISEKGKVQVKVTRMGDYLDMMKPRKDSQNSSAVVVLNDFCEIIPKKFLNIYSSALSMQNKMQKDALPDENNAKVSGQALTEKNSDSAHNSQKRVPDEQEKIFRLN